MLALASTLRRASVLTLAVTCLAALASSSRAHAGAAGEPAILAVRGKVLEPEKSIAVQAVTTAMARVGWLLTLRPFSNQEAEELVKCLPAEQPWPCLAKSVRDTTVRRLAVLSLESQTTADGTPMMIVTVQIATADQQDTAHGGRRYCQPCSPDSLAKHTTAAVEDVLERMYMRSGKTFLEVRSEPLGAIVTVDGKRRGVTNLSIPILPGPHQVEVALSKDAVETRTVELEEGKTGVVTVAFSPKLASQTPSTSKPKGPPSTPRPSRLLPVSLLAGGALLVAGGAVALLVDEDASDLPQPQTSQPETFRNTAPLGIGLIVAGAAAAGVGSWLWWRSSTKGDAKRTPSTALLIHPGGAAVSFSSPF
jgi:PEGA domain